jgi:hypothetical protein
LSLLWWEAWICCNSPCFDVLFHFFCPHFVILPLFCNSSSRHIIGFSLLISNFRTKKTVLLATHLLSQTLSHHPYQHLHGWLLPMDHTRMPIFLFLGLLGPGSVEQVGLFVLFFCGTGAWTQGLHLEPRHQPFFVMEFFKIGSRELFALAGFKP